MIPALFNVANAPFFDTVFSARAVSFTRTNFESSGTQSRLFLRFGVNVRGVFAVTCRPTPPFFFAIPRRWMIVPFETRAFVMLQTLDI